MVTQSFAPAIQPVRTDYARTSPGRSFSGREPSFYGVIAGVVVAILLAAIFIPQVLKHHAKPVAITQPAGTVPTPTTTIQLPSQLAGYIELVGAQADSWQQESDKDWPLATPHLAGLYGTTEAPRIFVMLGRVSLTASGVNDVLNGGEKGAREAGWAVTFQQKPTGEYGGQMRCGTTVRDGTSAAICIFADHAVFGQIYVIGQGAENLPTAMSTRIAVETLS